MPFESDEEPVQGRKIGLKQAVKQPAQAKEADKKLSKQEFDKRADEANNFINSRRAKLAESAKEFRNILDTKIIPQNKSTFVQQVERDVISRMAEIANDINNDDNEPECAGAMALITLLLRSILFQRDRISVLEYELHKLNKEKENV